MTNILRLILFLSLIPLAFAPALASEKPPIPGTRASQLDLVRDSVFYSVSLKREMRYRVLIPRDYEKNGRVRVLYLLHGLYGDYRNWDSYTGLQNYDGKLRLLIVMPDADDAWYTNSATVPLDRFEDYIVKDLISEIDEKYKTIRAAKGRAIAGLSMGGYGAVKLGLKYPQLFAFVGSLSGALNAAQNLDIQRPEFRPKLREVFGDEGSRTRGENDIFQLLSTPHQTPRPYFYLACGTNDFLLETNRALAEQLSSRSINYEYHETPGGHTWAYWDRALLLLLECIEDKFLE